MSGRYVSTFIKSSSGPLGKEIQELFIFESEIQSYVFHIHITQSVSIWDPKMH